MFYVSDTCCFFEGSLRIGLGLPRSFYVYNTSDEKNVSKYTYAL